MPKPATHALVWSSEHNIYAVYERGQQRFSSLSADDERWRTWLAERSSFSFQGRRGHLTLLKETRARGNEGYWYAYRRQGERRIKQYAGRTLTLTIARLEELAHTPDKYPSIDRLPQQDRQEYSEHEVPHQMQRTSAVVLEIPRQSVQERAWQQTSQPVQPLCVTDDAAPTSQLAISRGPLLASRLRPPPLQAALIPRERLHTLLDASLAYRLTLLSAPAGCGKTTLLAQWLACRRLPVAWLTLEREQNEPQRFLAYLIGALQRVHPDLSASILTGVQEGQVALSEGIVLLLNELAASPTQIILVLDNYHLIEQQCIHHALKLLLAHLPTHVHMIIATRSEPPGLLVRLRASGEFTELGTDALRLTREELEELLTRVLHLTPEPKELDVLAERVEGWIAGLYLARSSLQGQMDFAHLLAACAGTNRHIQTYFVEEVLADLPRETQTFLLHTSLLERCNSALCAAVTDQENTAHMLEELARANLFCCPLAEQEGWYRYHPLFASALRHFLLRTQPELLAILHLRASRWFEAHSLPTEAIEHALAARDHPRAATLIEGVAQSMISEGKLTILQTWLDSLPEEVVRSSPRLCICRIWQEFITSQPSTFILWVEAAEQALHRLEETLSPPTVAALQSEIIALRSVYTISFADFSSAIASCQQALQQLPADSHYLRGLILMLLGLAYTRSIDVGTAARLLSEAKSNLQAAGHALLLPYAMMAQAELYAVQGYPFQTAKLYRHILALETEPSISSFFSAGFAHLGLGCLLWEWNNLAEARYHLLQAWTMGQYTRTTTILFDSALLLVLIAQAQGDSAATQSWLQQLDSLSRRASYIEQTEIIAPLRARFALREGRLEEALFWMHEQNQRSAAPGYKRSQLLDLTSVRVLIAAGQAGIEPDAGTRALELLEHWFITAEQAGRVSVLVEILILQALALQLQHDGAGALKRVQRAVTLAEPGRYIRVFVTEGDPLARLLRHLLEQQRAQKVSGQAISIAYLSTLLKAFTQSGTFSLSTSHAESQPLLDPLSLREREVLRLLAAGRKNREIADELVVVTGTVKAHINTIYQKLGATNRVQAITRARALGLLP
ncbi:MAG TPA: LuxR C-terminal-related transcriptional regulator [Ktedonosporobacter sp.]|jgi:LuxR family maltose regulon positive regulatory protein|nr:LuxR C-terminal-related transcriptional regulator [Ktedonosporobacter sp.]